MDQIKTGKFIASCRKQHALTQRALAEQLGISDKTISKWETGNGFPEISLLLPLCEALEINVNELLSGERLTAETYKQNAEENMMNMIREKEENRKKMRMTVAIGIIATVAFLTLIFVVCMYTEVISTPIKVLLVTIACLIFGTGLLFAMEGDRTIGWFQCRHCGEKFVPGFWHYTCAMHILSTRHLKCPACHKRGWDKKVLSK